MGQLRAFPKPCEIEQIVTLTAKQRAKYRRELFDLQCGICACGCGRSMVWPQGQMETCTLDHITPNKMGCKKQSAAFNLQAVRYDCNFRKGSQRPGKYVPQVTVIQ